MSKEQSKGGRKEKQLSHWGRMSDTDFTKLFDRTSDLDHVFAKEVYERRKAEVDQCAAEAGFVKVNDGSWPSAALFRKKQTMSL